jgi:hypothetical protein
MPQPGLPAPGFDMQKGYQNLFGQPMDYWQSQMNPNDFRRIGNLMNRQQNLQNRYQSLMDSGGMNQNRMQRIQNRLGMVSNRIGDIAGQYMRPIPFAPQPGLLGGFDPNQPMPYGGYVPPGAMA